MALRENFFRLQEFALRFAASGLFPASWICNVPKSSQLATPAAAPETLEVVSHCWNYAHLLSYQLQSLIDYAPNQLTIKFTVFYCQEDQATVKLLDQYSAISHDNINWNFVELDKSALLRRAIGRNKAAKSTSADWIWFTDCDLVFGKNTFSSLRDQLTGQQSILVFPATVKRTSLLEKDNELLTCDRFNAADCLENDTCNFHTFEKATGPVQIVHGSIAREYGYCDQLACYQQRKDRWVKTYEDRAFRWLLGSHGEPIDVGDVGIIRHVEKGRYSSGSLLSKIREMNRRMKDKLLAR
ncbi:MAG: glycosyltransferase family A protein [Pseudomonadota bacterium]